MKALTEALLYENTANARLVGRNALKTCLYTNLFIVTKHNVRRNVQNNNGLTKSECNNCFT